MTTRLRKPVARKVSDAYGREYVAVLDINGVRIREPRKRLVYLAPYGAVFALAARLYGEAEKRRKRAEREDRKRHARWSQIGAER